MFSKRARRPSASCAPGRSNLEKREAGERGKTTQMGQTGQGQNVEPSSRSALGASPEGWPCSAGPLSLLRRMSEDMDRLFGEFFSLTPRSERPLRFGELTRWPEIDVNQHGNKLIVRADVPGLNKDDLTVEILEDELCISGERKSESRQEEGGYYRNERSYGSFCRTIPLPPGAKVDTASASFDKGVLEIEIEVPQESSRGRKIEVREPPSH